MIECKASPVTDTPFLEPETFIVIGRVVSRTMRQEGSVWVWHLGIKV